MANTKSSKKRARQNPPRALRNMSKRTHMRSTIKKAIKALQSNNNEAAATAVKETVSILDKMAGQGIIHKNKAARLKSRLNKKAVSLAKKS